MAFFRKTGDKRISDDDFSDDESSGTPLRKEYKLIPIEQLQYFCNGCHLVLFGINILQLGAAIVSILDQYSMGTGQAVIA